MTIITKVGTSYVEHMNDDTPEIDSFSCELPGSLLPVFEERPWEWGYPYCIVREPLQTVVYLAHFQFTEAKQMTS